jgi:ectoine hydroxylase-related dioxygenase (phytanoyl-CoA dioxygenase family)
MTTTALPSGATLPDLSSDYAAPPGKIDDFRNNGHTLLRGVAGPGEIAVYGAAIRDAADRCNTETRSMEERDTYGKAFLQIMNLWRQDEAVRRFTLARRFGKIAADLMGVDGVRLYHDQALFKEPHGGPTPWHQDQYYWPLDTNNTVTMWMPLVDVSIEMGALAFASGSGRDGFLGHLDISDKSDQVYDELVRSRGFAYAQEAMAAGDATFHSGWTLHHAPANQTGAMREVMTVIYIADGARISAPDNPHRENDLKSWMPGLAPGDLVASDLNPLIYSR